MQAINHAVFGALIAVTVHEPVVAIPLSLGSHFVMDAIPHYGNDPKAPRGSRLYYLRIIIDTMASFSILLLFLSFHPPHMKLIIVCASVAILPDLLWPLALHVKRSGPLWAFFKFHKLIQRESRSGILVEKGWLIITTLLVLYKIH